MAKSQTTHNQHYRCGFDKLLPQDGIIIGQSYSNSNTLRPWSCIYFPC